MAQTAVQWLQEIELKRGLSLADWMQAKRMEKEQREQAKAEGYELAMSEAIKEIHKNYKPI